MSKVVEKFLKYVKYDTGISEDTHTIPSTKGQLIFATDLVKELNEMGMSDVSLDDKGFVMATLPANINKEIPVIGFIAHLDTALEMTGENVNPQIVENYNGEDIILNEELNVVLSPKDFPILKKYIGETLITTDGTTLLGADGKSGIAEIMEAMEYLISHPEILHGKIRVAFTPDAEMDESAAEYFNVDKFKADFAYTLDGDGIGEINYENFNAAGVKITINGRSVHPGEAKNKMINSMFIADEIINMLPEMETPSHTEGYEGFYHLRSMSGDVEQTTLYYLIRDFDMYDFEKRKAYITSIVNRINEKYTSATANIDIRDDYYNMRERILPVQHVIDTAIKAMEELSITPIIVPIRGGTDGATLSFKGLPTPNIFAGGHNFHGRYEFIPVFAMEKSVEVILKIIELYCKM